MADIHHASKANGKSIVVYAHGINGFKDWGGMDLIAQEFAAAGHTFLKFNFSHNGTTPEHPEDFKDLEAYGNDNYLIRQADLKSVIDFIHNSSELSIDNGTTLIGHSRGGTDAILYAASDKRVSRLVTWAAVAEAKTPWRNWTTEQLEEWQENGVRFIKNSRTNQDLPLYYQLYTEYQNHHHQLNIENTARSIDSPWLIVHGTDDSSVFVKDAYSLKQWQLQAEVDIINHTGHTFDRSHPWTELNLPDASLQLVKSSIGFIEQSLSN